MIRLDLPKNTTVHALGFAAGGAALAYLQNRKLRYWDLAAGCPRKEWEAALRGDFHAHHLAISPDGLQVAAGMIQNMAYILALDPSPKSRRMLRLGGGKIAGMHFLGEPDRLVAAPTCEQIGDQWPRDERLGAAVWDTARGECIATMRLYDPTHMGTKSLAVAPGRPLVAMGIPDIHLLLWDPAPGETPGPVFEKSIRGRDPGWRSPDGGQPDPLMYGGGSSAKVLAFSPDGNLLAAVVGSRIIPWDLETRTRLPTLTGHGAAYAGGTGAVTAMAFAPVGRLLASVGREGTLRLWDPADPARPERARFEPGLGSLHAVAFSPDGTLVAVGGARGIALIDVDERLAG